MKLHLKVTALLLYAIIIGGFALSSQADNGHFLPAPYVPWLQAQGYALDSDDQTNIPPLRLPTPEFKSLNTIPDDAILSPRDTLALIETMHITNVGLKLAPPSPLEAAYSRRIIEQLSQFGYELFSGLAKTKENGARPPRLPPTGAVQDNFVLGIGDSLHITLRGQKNTDTIHTINSEGLLILDDIPPLPAAGLTIGAIRGLLEERMAQRYNTDIYISLDKIRQIDILVLGHVTSPGKQTLTVFHSILDALHYAGGIDKTGSLRQIKLVRGGYSTIIDLYGLLIHGETTMDMALRDGDKIIIPPIGPTVAIAGGVNRPAIYEILPHAHTMRSAPHTTAQKLTLEDMLELGGGVLTPGQNRFIMLSLTPDGKETVTDITSPHSRIFGNGSILSVAPSTEARSGTVELSGHTRRPGLHDLDKAASLSKLLSNNHVFGNDIYPLIGIIERRNKRQMTREFVEFPPLLVAQGQFDRKLQDNDIIHLFSRQQISALQALSQQTPEATPQALNKITPASGDQHPGHEIINDTMIQSFLLERTAFIRGAVRQEGAYPIAEGISLENLIAVSGGLTREASTGNIEVTSALLGEGHQAHGRSGTIRKHVNFAQDTPSDITLQPGDTVRVNQKFLKVADSSVLVVGQVNHPGRYDLIPGDTMSDLIERAGGLTQQAYAAGAIFSRESERRAEESRFRAAARDMERALAASMDDKDRTPDAAKIAMARELAAELRQVEAVGRVTVETDPGILASKPELDILLESGDRLYIPQRPLAVRVAGEVLSPASLQFRKEKNARDYIAEAGGFTYHADKGRTFVLYPDGSAQPLHLNTWNHNIAMIPPGSTIIVPRDPKPFDFIQSARDVSQILSNLAITGIFLDDLRNN